MIELDCTFLPLDARFFSVYNYKQIYTYIYTLSMNETSTSVAAGAASQC